MDVSFLQKTSAIKIQIVNGKNVTPNFCYYTSKKFNKNNPQTVKRIKENINTPFCTNNFIYTIMDITGVNFENNKNNINHSLLKD